MLISDTHNVAKKLAATIVHREKEIPVGKNKPLFLELSSHAFLVPLNAEVDPETVVPGDEVTMEVGETTLVFWVKEIQLNAVVLGTQPPNLDAG